MDERTRLRMASSRSEDWYTPLDLFKKLDKLFHFNCDPCTSKKNPLGVEIFYTKKENGLLREWYGASFINPPYTIRVGKRRADGTYKRVRVIDKWIVKGLTQSLVGVTCVFLISARPDTKIWQETILPHAKAVCYINKRQHYSDAEDPSFFPSGIVIFTLKPLPRGTEVVLSKLGRTFIFHDIPLSVSKGQARRALMY